MPGRRRALSNVEGEGGSRGDPAFAVPLSRALEAPAHDPELADALTHGFHTYPARMHPAIARTLLRELSLRAGVVLDPFCGSGTVAIEAMLAGWRSLGSDLDPLAVRLARVKTRRCPERERERFVARLEAVGAASEARVRGRVPVRARLPREELAWYEVHVLKELAGLWEELRAVEAEDDRSALEMVFSAILVKFSRQASDTRTQTTTKRIRKGLVTEFFVRKGKELARRWADLDAALPVRSKRPRFLVADVRSLPETIGGAFTCDLVLCSPPYAGTYDYVEHHARRHAWLGLDASKLERQELGARRRLARGPGAARLWEREVGAMLASVATLLRTDGVAVLLTGDGEVAGQRIVADAQLERLAPEHGLRLLAVASQARPDWRGAEPRREHLVALIKG